MVLLLDFGNARLKWAVAHANEWRSGAIGHVGRSADAVLDELLAEVGRPDRVLAVSVGPEDLYEAIDGKLSSAFGTSVRRIRADAALVDVQNRYRVPRTLGADRLVAAVAARGLARGAISVVDCGTAVTVDAISASGDFLGGVILPGMTLQREALAKGTAAVRAKEVDSTEVSCIARATGEALVAGIRYGLAGAIDRILLEQRRLLGDAPEVFITGGDAPQVLDLLETTVSHAPDLVLQGLLRISREVA